METQKIKDSNVKDIFEALLGEEYAAKVLGKIQEAYDKEVSGQEFIDNVKSILNEIPDFDKESVQLAVTITILSLPHHPFSLPHHPISLPHHPMNP